jgi:hypothetical protein
MSNISRFAVVVAGVATLFVAGCAVEVPKSALPFNLAPPPGAVEDLDKSKAQGV